jgi:hypothetical protein
VKFLPESSSILIPQCSVALKQRTFSLDLLNLLLSVGFLIILNPPVSTKGKFILPTVSTYSKV